MYEEVVEYDVQIETSRGIESIPIIASGPVDLWEQASEIDEFIRIVTINE